MSPAELGSDLVQRIKLLEDQLAMAEERTSLVLAEKETIASDNEQAYQNILLHLDNAAKGQEKNELRNKLSELERVNSELDTSRRQYERVNAGLLCELEDVQYQLSACEELSAELL
jgi:hypothetical protein